MCSCVSRMRPSMIVPRLPSFCARVDINPPQQAEGRPLGCWMYMMWPSLFASAKWRGGVGPGLFVSTIFTVMAGP